MKRFLQKYKIQLKLLGILTVGLLILFVTFYNLIPIILNYPEGTYKTNFQHELENTDYNVQAISMALTIFATFIAVVFYKTRFLIKYSDLLQNPQNYSEDTIDYVKNQLYNAPYSMYILNILLPSFIITFIHAYTIQQIGITTLKIFILMFSFITVYVSGVLLYSRKLFTNLLVNLPISDKINFRKTSIKSRFFYHIVPIIIVAILFTSLIGYSRVVVEKGNSMFEIYKERLNYLVKTKPMNSLQDLEDVSTNLTLIDAKDRIFIYTPNGKYLDSYGKEIQFSKYFTKYLNEMSASHDGRIYEYYGMDDQGASVSVNINGEKYILGVYFEIISINILIYFVITFVALLIIAYFILNLFSNSFASEIRRIVNKFSAMTESNDNNFNKKLPIISNDEIGELCLSFNNVQDLTKKYVQEIHSNQEILIEKERLATLGQMIGGIAHNLKTPIMSISGAREALQDLTKEYDESIDDPNVTPEDHHAIAKDMSDWLEKIKTHLAYMSDIITAVKGQAVNMSTIAPVDFTISEVLKQVDILMKHELKNALIILNINCDVNPNTNLYGNVTSLVQVINNIISNAIQSYNGTPNKTIDLSVFLDRKDLIIAIRDYGSGMSESVKSKLFNSMITTKGKKGTGLGLFMSYSNIKAHFNGNITFESEENKGTTFYIHLPLK